MSLLKMDSVTSSILEKLTLEVNEKFGTSLTVGEVKAIVETQFQAIPVAISVGEGLRLPNLGTFVIKPKSAAKLPQELIEKQHQLSTSGINPLVADYSVGY